MKEYTIKAQHMKSILQEKLMLLMCTCFLKQKSSLLVLIVLLIAGNIKEQN